MNNSRESVHLAIIKEKKLILGFREKRGGKFIPLGGKRLIGETDRECLERVLKKEVYGSIMLLLENAQYIEHGVGRSKSKTSPHEMDFYATTIGKLTLEPTKEIPSFGEFFYDDIIESKKTSEVAKKMAKTLKDLNLIL